jgi:hypothetical protein
MFALTMGRYCFFRLFQCQSFAAPPPLFSGLDRPLRSVILPAPLKMHPPAAILQWVGSSFHPFDRVPAMPRCKAGRDHRRSIRFWIVIVGGFTLLAALGPGVIGAENLKTESRTPFLHHIPLRDAEGQIISLPPAFDEQGKPQEPRANPFSTAQTCGRCHEYEAIGRGWHFNAALGNVKPGRPGEPWILTDPLTHSQIPLSYRGWKGTFKPADLGMSDFDFLMNFARHLPGGGPGEPAQIDPKDPKSGRMQITGKMEIDCLLCHESTGHYNHETRFKAMNAQNIKWAPSIGAGLGTFAASRNAKAFADSWKPGRPVPTNLPAIKYDRSRFDADNNVVFQVTRRAAVNNCYYCHTSETTPADARWHSDLDFHIRAGMTCIDCHRNGIDHMIVRGYEGEPADRAVSPDLIEVRAKILRRDNASLSDADARKLAGKQLENEMGMVGTLSCRGCHYGTDEAKQATAQLGGRLGAPRPIHKGLPPVHFEKMTCTACHSGPFPGDQPQVVHTSLAHKLGLPGPARGENTPPVIVQPVFLKGDDGRITPNKVVWPSYWGRLKDGKITPLPPEEVAKTDKLPAQPADDVARDPYNTRPLTDAQIQPVLEALAADKSKGEPIFIAAGKAYQLEGGKLKAEEHGAAKPYVWALAHDVRPARQALGARGCADCHSTDSPLYFATVAARGPVDPGHAASQAAWQLRGENKSVITTFASTFALRPMLKVITFACALIVLAVLVNYGLLGVNAITRAGRSNKNPQDRQT